MKNKTLLLFLDAVRFVDLGHKNTPFLYGLAKEGIYGPLRTLPGYHVEYSIMSGWNPLKHNIWSWFYFSPERSHYKWLKGLLPLMLPLDRKGTQKYLRKMITYVTCILRILKGRSRLLDIYQLPLDKIVNFSISVDKSFIDQNSMCVPTLFDILKKNNVNYFASEYPTRSTPRGVSYQIAGRSDTEKFEQLKEMAGQGHDFLFSHVWNFDSVQHRYGPRHPEALTYLKQLDAQVEDLVNSLRQSEEWDVVLFSDHGFINIKGTLNVTDVFAGLGLKEEVDYTIFPDSTMARIWLKDPSQKKAVAAAFSDLPCKVFDEHNIGELSIPYDRAHTGDLLVSADLGYQISPNLFQGSEVASGMHGYRDHVDELDGVFVANSTSLGRARRLEHCDLVDVLPTLLALMGIEHGLEFGGVSKIS